MRPWRAPRAADALSCAGALEDVAERGEVGVDAALDGLCREGPEERGSAGDPDFGVEPEERACTGGGELVAIAEGRRPATQPPPSARCASSSMAGPPATGSPAAGTACVGARRGSGEPPLAAI